MFLCCYTLSHTTTLSKLVVCYAKWFHVKLRTAQFVKRITDGHTSGQTTLILVRGKTKPPLRTRNFGATASEC